MTRLASLALLAVLLCSACASASGTTSGPNGKPTYVLIGITGAALLKTAGNKCPSGYVFITPPYTDASGFQEATIECKV
jgi:hypothetical protein